MKKAILLITGMSAICGCSHLSNNDIDQSGIISADKPGTYYGQLKSMLSQHRYNIRPKPSERDINLIEVEKGGAGVLFGATMDDVVAVWGKPTGFMITGLDDVWDLEMGACDFGFLDNSLVVISIHSATLETAHFKNGIGFESTIDDVLSAFGEPNEATDYTYKFVNENGYVIKFHFVPDSDSRGKEKLINIEVCHPDSGE